MKNFSSQFDGKIAVITGGTQGLGLATAQLLAARGAAGLIICGRNADKGEEAAAALAGDHCPTSFVKADLAEVADCQNVVADQLCKIGVGKSGVVARAVAGHAVAQRAVEIVIAPGP